MPFLRKINPVLLVIIICILSRIPILASADLRLDSDECVLGLMAKHLYKNQDYSIYFWGQTYGISIIEEFFVVPFYMAHGIAALAVKLGMLCLWTIGVTFFYKSLRQIRPHNQKEAFLITLLLIASPSWALWSMKARGGYLTAFVFSNVALYLLFHARYNKKTLTYIIAGIIFSIVFESQLFWLSGLIPLVAYKFIKDKNILKPLLMVGSGIGCELLASSYKKGIDVFYRPPSIQLTKSDLFSRINRIPDFLYTHMHGTYHFSWAHPPNFFAAFFAIVITAIIFMLLVHAVVSLFQKEMRSGLFIFSVAFIPATFLYSLFTPEMQYRYLLPVTAYTLIALFLLLEKYPMTKLIKSHIIVLLIIGFAGVASFWKSQWLRSEREPLLNAIKFLENNNIKYVYCADYTFQWDIMFLTNEKITERFFTEPGRHPVYDFAVDKALASGEKTAVFGNSDRRFGEKFEHYEMDNVYYISVNPTKESLQSIFEFKPIPGN